MSIFDEHKDCFISFYSYPVTKKGLPVITHKLKEELLKEMDKRDEAIHKRINLLIDALMNTMDKKDEELYIRFRKLEKEIGD